MTSPNNNTGAEPNTPGWVKILGIIALIFVLVFIVLHLTGLAPRSHMPSHDGHKAQQP